MSYICIACVGTCVYPTHILHMWNICYTPKTQHVWHTWPCINIHTYLLVVLHHFNNKDCCLIVKTTPCELLNQAHLPMSIKDNRCLGWNNMNSRWPALMSHLKVLQMFSRNLGLADFYCKRLIQWLPPGSGSGMHG